MFFMLSKDIYSKDALKNLKDTFIQYDLHFNTSANKKMNKKRKKNMAQKKTSKKFYKQNIKNTINKNHLFQNNMKHLAKKITQTSIRNDYKYFRKVTTKTCYWDIFSFSFILALCKMNKAFTR